MKITKCQKPQVFQARIGYIDPKIKTKLGPYIWNCVNDAKKIIETSISDKAKYSFRVYETFPLPAESIKKVKKSWPRGRFYKGGQMTEDGLVFSYLEITCKKQIIPDFSQPKTILGKLYNQAKVFFLADYMEGFTLLKKEHVERIPDDSVNLIVNRAEQMYYS